MIVKLFKPLNIACVTGSRKRLMPKLPAFSTVAVKMSRDPGSEPPETSAWVLGMNLTRRVRFPVLAILLTVITFFPSEACRGAIWELGCRANGFGSAGNLPIAGLGWSIEGGLIRAADDGGFWRMGLGWFDPDPGGKDRLRSLRLHTFMLYRGADFGIGKLRFRAETGAGVGRQVYRLRGHRIVAGVPLFVAEGQVKLGSISRVDCYLGLSYHGITYRDTGRFADHLALALLFGRRLDGK